MSTNQPETMPPPAILLQMMTGYQRQQYPFATGLEVVCMKLARHLHIGIHQCS